MKHTTLCLVFALCVGSAVANGTHTVTFRRLNGTVLLQTNALHGANATAMAPELPAETGMTAQGWDHVDWLACVTNDVTCWALYEASTAMSPSTSIASQSVIDRATPYSLEEYFQIYDNLAWSDEFSGSSLSVGSGKNWNYDTEQRNNELQRYTSNGNNHIVSDGTLKLECRRESSGGKSFTSGSIKSNGKVQFKYGRCEIRAKLTKQQGTWPAFWTMGTGSWPACGELDVFEQVNGSEWIGGNFHLPKGSATISNSGLVCPEDGTHWGDAFHRIGFIFNEFEIVWYVDDHIFKRMDIRNTSRYSMMHDRYRYILLNLAFGGNWPGQMSASDSTIANFQSEAFEIDYCRIFTNTTANRTIEREAEPEGAKLTTPVNATVWRGWQMRWAKSGSYRSGLDRSEAAFFKAAMTEYFTRDNADIVTFLTRPAENTGATDLTMPFNIPGVTSLFLSPEQGSNNNSWDGDTREKLLSGVLFNKNRFSQTRSAIGTLRLSDDANYTNCCAVVAELVEKDSGAKVTVVSVNVSQTNGIDYATLFTKLDAFKDERAILFFQSMDSAYHTPLKNQASASLDSAYQYLGEYKVWPTYQFAYATANYEASAANPAPLSVPKANGQASGVHTNQAYCATVQFEAEPEVVIEYGQLDQSAFAKKMTVSFTGYSGTALTDFPVLVKLSTDIDGFSYGDFTLTNGGDLRFADASGNLLAHEIDTWNESGVSTVWVKVPSLSSAATIKAYWGCTGTPQAVDSKDVWDENYVGVWHLGESALPMKESSGISTDFSASNNGTETLGANGAIGGAVDFSAGNTNARLSANDDDDLDGFTDCTFEFWTKQAAEPSANAFLLTKRMKNAEDVAYVLYGNKDTGKGIFGVSTTGGAPTSIIGSSQNMLPTWGEWCHQAFVRNASGTQKAYGYMNGEARGSSSFTNTAPIHASASKLHLGNAQSGGNAYNGMIDEVRISKVARSAAWIKATHDTVTMTNFATYAVGGAQPAEPDRILYVNVAAGMTDTLNAALVTAYITNIVKTGAGTLAASAIPDYAGAFDIQGGVFQVSNAGDCGAAGAVINVRDGASLEYLGGAANVLSGKTVNLYGAKASSAAAKVVFSNTENRNIGSSVSVNLKDSDEVFYIARGKNINWTSGTIDLGGHELRLKATSSSTRYEIGATFTNGGSVVYEKCLMFAETYAPILGQAGASGATLRLENAAFNLKKAMNPNGWNIVCSNSYMTGNTVKFPQNTGVPNWDGDVQFLKASSMANYGGGWNVSNTVFNLKGAVSGSGTLSVGPGWLNLHNADNTYSGAVTVSGENLTSSNPILPGGGGIGLWNGAACFPNASSITFNNSARLAFMDSTVCTVGSNVVFAGGVDDVQSVSGGVYTARSTMAGFTKTGAGTLVFDSPVSVTGTGDVQAGTLTIAYRSDPTAQTQEAMLNPLPVFSSLRFADGANLDLSDNLGLVVGSLEGSPMVTNSGMFGVSGTWKLVNPAGRLKLLGQNAGGGQAAGVLCFLPGATFDLADEAAFQTAVASAGPDGLLVAEANWILSPEQEGMEGSVVLPEPVQTLSPGWSMAIGNNSNGDYGRGLYLRYAAPPASGYAVWMAEKGMTGNPEDTTYGIENAVRYAFDIGPETTEIGDPPILQVVMDGNDNPAVRSRDLAEGRDDVTFDILATEDLGDWSDTALVPMMKSQTDGLWRPTASETPGYVYPNQMFFKYTIEVQ